MTQSLSDTAIDLQSTGNLGQLEDGPTSRDFHYSTSPSTSIHILDDDSIIIIFSFCRPVILDESEVDETNILGGGEWNRERWWHRLIQVCRRWRCLLIDSAFHLQVSLVCGRGTPVADMLAHSPPAIPLIIDHFDDNYQALTIEDEKGIILALQNRHRVRRIRIIKPTPILQKLIIALDGDFPVLEFMFIWHQRYHRPLIEPTMNLSFPETFRAPHLRQLMLKNFVMPMESPSLTTMGNLTTLYLFRIPTSAYFHPNILLQRLSFMPQLEALWIGFNVSRDVERQLSRTSIMTRVTLPNLRWLGFRGTNAYLEALLPCLTTPLLEKLRIYFFNRMVYSIPHLRQFIDTAGNLLVKTAALHFHEDYVRVMTFRHTGDKLRNLDMELGGRHFDWQIFSAAQVFCALGKVFSLVEHLTLNYFRHNISSEWNNEANRTHWCELLGAFKNVKTISVDGNLVEQLSGALQLGAEGSPTELLPELQKLSYSALRSAIGASRDAFTQFTDARQKAGRPVTVNRL